MILTPFRTLRSLWRIAQVVLLVLAGIAIVRMLFPHWSPLRRRQVKQAWAARLVATLGVRIESAGEAFPEQALIVSNHVSWLDVFVINALTPATFVCKDDVKHWPAIGWLVAHTGTLFIERGSRAAAARSAQAIAERLQAGERVAIFPEGTTTQGLHLLPFRAALFEAALGAGCAVQPLALRYLDETGKPSIAPAYDGDVSFGQSMLSIARSTGLRARLQVLPALPPTADRRALALHSETAIATALGFSLEETQALDAPRPAPESAATPVTRPA